MKIIKLGDFIFRFICPDCGTEFEIETKELIYFPQYNKYAISCPLCNKILYMKDDFENADGVNVIKTIKRREELESEKK